MSIRINTNKIYNILSKINKYPVINVNEKEIIERTIMEINNNTVNLISDYVFYNCSKLIKVDFPECTNIGQYAFDNCINLTSISFTECTNIGSDAFNNCFNLTSAIFPKCTTIGQYAFYRCSSLTSATFPKCTSIGSYTFGSCSSLISIYLMASSLCTLAASNAFGNTQITSSTGYIYVPSLFLTSYKTATNWTYFSNRIFGM